VHVLGSVDRRKGVQDLDKVVIERGIGRAATNCGLPGVPMRIDKAWYHDRVAGVDHLGIGANVRLDADDLVVFDEYVSGEISDLGIHAYDASAADECPACHLAMLLCTVSGFVGSSQKAASRRTASTTLSTVGITSSSSASANGSGTHSAATRRIGASSNSNPSSATIDATVAPQPPW